MVPGLSSLAGGDTAEHMSAALAYVVDTRAEALAVIREALSRRLGPGSPGTSGSTAHHVLSLTRSLHRTCCAGCTPSTPLPRFPQRVMDGIEHVVLMVEGAGDRADLREHRASAPRCRPDCHYPRTVWMWEVTLTYSPHQRWIRVSEEPLTMTLGVVWLDGPLAVLSLGVGLLYVVMVITRAVRPASGSAHAVMGVGMAAMFVPRFDPLPRGVWIATFVLIGAWFGATALREGLGFGESAHHVVGAAAMVFMLLTHRHDAAAPADPGHAHHAAVAGGAPAGYSALALALAAYFAAHAVRHLLAREPAGDAPVPVGVVRVFSRVDARRALPASHVVMGTTMVVMLLGMV